MSDYSDPKQPFPGGWQGSQPNQPYPGTPNYGVPPSQPPGYPPQGPGYPQQQGPGYPQPGSGYGQQPGYPTMQMPAGSAGWSQQYPPQNGGYPPGQQFGAVPPTPKRPWALIVAISVVVAAIIGTIVFFLLRGSTVQLAETPSPGAGQNESTEPETEAPQPSSRPSRAPKPTTNPRSTPPAAPGGAVAAPSNVPETVGEYRLLVKPNGKIPSVTYVSDETKFMVASWSTRPFDRASASLDNIVEGDGYVCGTLKTFKYPYCYFKHGENTVQLGTISKTVEVPEVEAFLKEFRSKLG